MSHNWRLARSESMSEQLAQPEEVKQSGQGSRPGGPGGLGGPADLRYSEKSVRSFVVRSGKFTQGQQQAYWRLKNRYCLEYQNFCHPGLSAECAEARMWQYWQALLRADNSSETPQPSLTLPPRRQLLCEIGFGTGSASWQIARQNPQALYLGLEVYRSGIASLMRKAEEEQLSQLRIIEHDALEVLENMLPPGLLDGLYIFFPDPWPKKRHQKRRLVNSGNLRLFHRSLRPGAHLYFVTDWQDYAEAVREALQQQVPALWQLGEAEEAIVTGQAYSEPQHWRPRSKFEAKAGHEGRPVFELYMQKRS